MFSCSRTSLYLPSVYLLLEMCFTQVSQSNRILVITRALKALDEYGVANAKIKVHKVAKNVESLAAVSFLTCTSKVQESRCGPTKFLFNDHLQMIWTLYVSSTFRGSH
jgi:hypothetical protein